MAVAATVVLIGVARMISAAMIAAFRPVPDADRSGASRRLRALAALSGSLTDALAPKDAAELLEQKADSGRASFRLIGDCGLRAVHGLYAKRARPASSLLRELWRPNDIRT
jgi:hypothetical protein